jgi:hypothetical protein
MDCVWLVNHPADLDIYWTVYYSYNDWIKVCRR